VNRVLFAAAAPSGEFAALGLRCRVQESAAAVLEVERP